MARRAKADKPPQTPALESVRGPTTGMSESVGIARFNQWFSDSYSASQTWRDMAEEDYRFVSGEQWSETELAKNASLDRPSLTINKILGPVLFLLGLQRQLRQEPKLLPFEGGDVQPTEIMSTIYKWCATRCREPRVDSHVWEDKVITGLSFWKTTWDYENDIEGRLLHERINPLTMFPDPNWLEAGWERAEYNIESLWRHPDDARALWPEHEEAISKTVGDWLSQGGSGATTFAPTAAQTGDPLSDKRLFWDATNQKIRINEIWYYRRVLTSVAIHRDSKQIQNDPHIVAAIMADPALAGEHLIVRRPIKRVWLAHVFNNIVLDNGPSPYREQILPYFPSIGYYFWRQPFGVVEPMKDPQRERNKRRSMIIEMVTKNAVSGYYNKKNGGAKTEDLEKFAKGSGVVINYDDTPPVMIKAPELPQTLVFLEQQSDGEIRDVVNVHQEMLGNSSQKTVSGRAIEARQRSGLTVQEPLMESFVQDKEPSVLFAISLIQQFMPIGQAARILGTVAQRTPDSPMAEIYGQAQDQVGQLEALIRKAFSTKYDVIIGTKPFEASVNQGVAENIMALTEKLGPVVPPELIIDALRDAGALPEEAAQKILANIKRQMQPPPGPPPGPPEMGGPPPGMPPPGMMPPGMPPQ